MNPTLVLDIADLALSLAENHMKKDDHQEGVSVAETLLQIIRISLRAYREHTGKTVHPSLIKA